MFPVIDWSHAHDTELAEGSKCSVRIQALSSRCGGMNRDKQNNFEEDLMSRMCHGPTKASGPSGTVLGLTSCPRARRDGSVAP